MTPRTEPLQAASDDDEDPSHVTLFPPESECPRTCWVTIDVDDAVDLWAMT